MEHFIVGTDETCLLASANGMVKILGDKNKKKHEKILNDSRHSITMVRCASTGGATGPTNFLMSGQRKKAGYDSQFLQTHGAAPGSTIEMTPTAFMTEEAWENMAQARADGIRAMPVICDHPDYWVVEILDGFSAHFSSPKDLQIYADAKIMQLKEEGDTSHVNQLYDQDPAKKDKVAMRSGLDMLRQAVSGLMAVDQWQLVHVGLMAVREGVENPDMWINAAKKVNLHPKFRQPFSAWLEKIAHFLEGGKTFKLEPYSTDIYPLLPPLWHAMSPHQKRLVVEIVNRNGGYSPQCLKELFSEAHVLYSDMQKLRLCVDAAKEDPSHLDRGVPVEEESGDLAGVAPELAEVVAAQAPVTHGLKSFELKPQDVHGAELFEHMVQFRMRQSSDWKPSAALNVEMTKDQEKIIAPTSQDLSIGSILKDAGGEGATKKLAKRKLNNTGAITSHCGIQNHPERVSKLINALQLTASLAEISAQNKATKDLDKRNANTALMENGPEALTKLSSVNGEVSKLTKKEICAISLRYFAVPQKESDSKAALTSALNGLIQEQPTVLVIAAATAAATSDPLTATTQPPQPAPAAEQESDEEYDPNSGSW